MKLKTIALLGSTGSIGQSTLDIIKKTNTFKVVLIIANSNYSKILSQIKSYKPKIVIIRNLKAYLRIKKTLNLKKIIILNNINSIEKYIQKIDITVSAIPGLAGLEPTLKFIKLSKKVLLANKESIVCGWKLIKKEATKYSTKLVPIDSEHFSISELTKQHTNDEIEKIYITASGGPFLKLHKNKFKNVKPKDAIKHPKWKMGKKISIDSSTLMNKILQLIEAQKLFNITNDKIDILIHPNSLVHAIVKLKNGITKLLYHETSMIVPLANAIFDGKLNIENFYNPKKKSKDEIIGDLSFKNVDRKIFPIIDIKKRANEFPSTSIIINAANEILVEQFLHKKVPFLTIYKLILSIMNDKNYRKYAIRKPNNIVQILAIDSWTKSVIKKRLCLKKAK